MWVSHDREKQHAVELTVQLVVDESTRVLGIVEKELELSLLVNEDLEVRATVGALRIVFRHCIRCLRHFLAGWLPAGSIVRIGGCC